jgi:hypothetical protein
MVFTLRLLAVRPCRIQFGGGRCHCHHRLMKERFKFLARWRCPHASATWGTADAELDHGARIIECTGSPDRHHKVALLLHHGAVGITHSIDAFLRDWVSRGIAASFVDCDCVRRNRKRVRRLRRSATGSNSREQAQEHGRKTQRRDSLPHRYRKYPVRPSESKSFISGAQGKDARGLDLDAEYGARTCYL